MFACSPCARRLIYPASMSGTAGLRCYRQCRARVSCRNDYPRSAHVTQVHGGAPYGAGTLAGDDGLRQPSEFELGYAKHQASAHLWALDTLMGAFDAHPSTTLLLLDAVTHRGLSPCKHGSAHALRRANTLLAWSRRWEPESATLPWVASLRACRWQSQAVYGTSACSALLDLNSCLLGSSKPSLGARHARM